MPGPNFLLGYGERLTERIEVGRGPVDKKAPYSFAGARDRLAPMVAAMSRQLDALPAAACPNDEAVSVVTIHPQFIAKSYYPGDIFRAAGLEPVGSRASRITPERWTRKGDPRESPATDILVAAPRTVFRDLAQHFPEIDELARGARDLVKIESFRAEDPLTRLRQIPPGTEDLLLEVVLHSPAGTHYILDAFRDYIRSLRVRADLERRLHAGRLCFIPVRANPEQLESLAKFSFLRVARPMPKLRPLSPLRSYSLPSPAPALLPTEPPVSSDIHAAIFDGGLRDIPELSQWVSRYEPRGIGRADRQCLHHGGCVTSALLFGPLQAGQVASRPFAHVDHYRVLDTKCHHDDDLFDVLRRIQTVLQSGRYKFVNLSIGPDLPIDDDEVHVWTAVLDDLLSSGDILTTVAAGNNGEGDALLRFDRVQVPADCVNALGVGAADSPGSPWRRATYSAVGPGRSPGRIKPDVLAFGGSDNAPFLVVDPDAPSRTYPQIGTSFASPLALRLALGVRAHFGDVLSPLALRALLVHCAEDGAVRREEQGWGRIPGSVEDLVICPEGTARIVYQGELTPAQHLRAPVPLPAASLLGNVGITATLCYATAVDPEDPGSYTRSGLEVVFRPHDEKFGTYRDNDGNEQQSTHPATDSFFQLHDYSSEEELRQDAHKWETVLHRHKSKRGSSLKNPVFDIHFVPRASGAPSRTTERIRYALILSVASPRTPDLYDRIVQRYRTQIQPLAPIIQIPVRT